MNSKRKMTKVLIILVMIVVLAQPTIAANPNPRVASPVSKPYGKTYGEWSAEWWKYVISFPSVTSPVKDPTGANCAAGQSGPVFFLAGGTEGVDVVRDQCSVPVGKAVMFPIITFLCAVPEDGVTAQDIQALCSSITDNIDVAQVTVDGVPVVNLLDNYRFVSPFFSFTGAVDNPGDMFCTGAPPGECYEGFHTTGFSDGYWVMLEPLSAGRHVIQINGHFSVPDFEFNVNITYHLTVSPREP